MMAQLGVPDEQEALTEALQHLRTVSRNVTSAGSLDHLGSPSISLHSLVFDTISLP